MQKAATKIYYMIAQEHTMALLDADPLILLFLIVVQVSSDTIVRNNISIQYSTLCADADKINRKQRFSIRISFSTLISSLRGCTTIYSHKETINLRQ